MYSSLAFPCTRHAFCGVPSSDRSPCVLTPDGFFFLCLTTDQVCEVLPDMTDATESMATEDPKVHKDPKEQQDRLAITGATAPTDETATHGFEETQVQPGPADKMQLMDAPGTTAETV